MQNPCSETSSQVHDLSSVLVQGVWAATGQKGEGFECTGLFSGSQCGDNNAPAQGEALYVHGLIKSAAAPRGR